ncbi:hypothetical protein [Kistimonas asteriae]|uniref:hypothetical protein n=1 Tax=Kistimonas asteriae TaxID=517724 RepID=UPI001BAAD7D9|nr:hypothetical protein [Kistimonas asteriae]
MNNNTATLHTLNTESIATRLKLSQSAEEHHTKCNAIADLAVMIKEKAEQGDRADQIHSLATAIVDMAFAVSDNLDDIADTANLIASQQH